MMINIFLFLERALTKFLKIIFTIIFTVFLFYIHDFIISTPTRSSDFFVSCQERSKNIRKLGKTYIFPDPDIEGESHIVETFYFANNPKVICWKAINDIAGFGPGPKYRCSRENMNRYGELYEK